ncbi:MAG: hypothetical protein CL880_03240 [Dehalococcoidia bacterium]|nr:hypothetical protein [Dehalococcoidia bacterium]MAX04068.1 hypothetical protein [Dehalococcoidia bacterium]|tara:strand:+ start:768 stop:1370 length:603 start_codon:yes stop_codon:yes gene_type:complete
MPQEKNSSANLDLNKILLTGENSFIRLKQTDDGPITTKATHWRILKSPGGPGHVLFIQSDITDNEVRIYSDNFAMTRWIQEKIESALNPEFADPNLPIIDSEFSSSGDGINYWIESIDSLNESIQMNWHGIGEPFYIKVAAGFLETAPKLGVYSCMIPSAKAQITNDDITAVGSPYPELFDGHPTSSCCLAWSETWTELI